MGWFSKFRMLFNKSISVLPYQRNDMVSFVKLKNGMLKIGCDAVVDEGFNLVIVYYNRVCDLLRPGTYKLDEVSVPKLFRFSKSYLTKRGLFTPKSIKTDAYFINLKEFSFNQFKTPERIIAYKNDEKIKIKLEGSFSFKVVDPEKLMKALCNDFAIIRNKRAIKEICSLVSFNVSKILNNREFLLEDFISKKEKVIESIDEVINKNLNIYGVETFNFLINNVILPKRFVDDKKIKELKMKQESFDQFNVDVSKMVEERLDSLQKELSVVYVNEKGETIHNIDLNLNSENNVAKSEQNFVAPDRNFASQAEDLMEKAQEEIHLSVNQPEPNIIKSPQDLEMVHGEVVVNDEFVDNIINKINKRKKQKRNHRIVEILSSAGVLTNGVDKTKPLKEQTLKCTNCGTLLTEGAKFCFKCGKSTDELKLCACCGAKNFSNAKICCVCKSRLD